MEQRQRGFTIVEILIVIVVIAVLAAVSIVAFRGVQERARDSRRMSDLSQLNKVIQQYIANVGHAPYFGTDCPPGVQDPGCYANDIDSGGYWATLRTELAPYRGNSPLPADPCGVNCWQKRYADFSTCCGGGGYFTYRYDPPGLYPPTVNGRPLTQYSYAIYAQNLESRTAQYGFGFGSF